MALLVGAILFMPLPYLQSVLKCIKSYLKL